MLGARITALRKAAGMNQSQLANKLQISTSAIGMYEQGRREPSVSILISLAQVLDVSIDFLLTGKPANEAERQRLQQILDEQTLSIDKQLASRTQRTLSRQELAILFAALLMEP